MVDGWFNGTEYIRFGDQSVAQTFTAPSLPTRYTFTDHLGTPLPQTSPTGSVAWRAEYEPYGSVYSYRAGDASDPQALRLPGQDLAEFSDSDKESTYNIFRWYSSGWGRYTQGDPIGIGRSKSLFEYGKDNPITWIDPTGLSSYPPLPDCNGLGWGKICLTHQGVRRTLVMSAEVCGDLRSGHGPVAPAWPRRTPDGV